MPGPRLAGGEHLGYRAPAAAQPFGELRSFGPGPGSRGVRRRTPLQRPRGSARLFPVAFRPRGVEVQEGYPCRCSRVASSGVMIWYAPLSSLSSATVVANDTEAVPGRCSSTAHNRRRRRASTRRSPPTLWSGSSATKTVRGVLAAGNAQPSGGIPARSASSRYAASRPGVVCLRYEVHSETGQRAGRPPPCRPRRPKSAHRG